MSEDLGEHFSAQDVLREVFGIEEATTQAVLMHATEKSRQEAVQLISEMAVKSALKDMGTIASKAVADMLESSGLRPSAYGFLPDVTEAVVRRVLEALQGEDAEVFARAFNEYLGMRG